MRDPDAFQLNDFLPYLLNRAAEATSLAFRTAYRGRYGMLRTEWRVLFHLARYGPMAASEICTRAGIHKTKVSRAVAALEGRRFVSRATEESDRRRATLRLTRAGEAAFHDLAAAAERYDADLVARLGEDEAQALRRALAVLAGLDDANG